MSQKSLSSNSVSVMPVLLLGFIHVVVTPLREIFSIEPLLMVPYYLFGLLIGVYIYRRSNTIKDYEYRRSKVMKKMKNVYAAEEAGVWQTNVAVPDKIENQANLSGDVSVISREAPEFELSDDDKVEVSMLNESQHVIEATRRVAGKSTFDDQEVESTIGASRKSSPMDRLLDLVTGIFSKSSASDNREQKRLAALQAASDASPVKAEKPQVPIQYERNQVVIGPESAYVDDFASDNNRSAEPKTTDAAPQTKQYTAFAPPNNNTTVSQSLESMAMLPSSSPRDTTLPKQNQAQVCHACGYPIKPDDRFCDNCGIDVNKSP